MTFLGLRLPVALLFFLGFPAFWLLWIGAYALTPGPASPQKQIEVIIPARTGLAAITDILAEKKVIRGDARFAMLAFLAGSGNRLKAGEYVFETGRRPLYVIERLRKGEVLYRPVTIPEGMDLKQIAEVLAAGGWADYQGVLDLAHDPAILADLGINADSLEGYLFPDTYYLSRGQQSPEAIIRMMVSHHFQVYDELKESGTGRTPVQLSHHAVVTLASIVEKETGLDDERGLVASVYLNRLTKGMRLQADPTVSYGLEKKSAILSRDDLQKTTTYNTYKITGLPPGPICNPGRAAIKAVLYPAESDYLYFVAKDDRSHYFSKSLQEHNKAVIRYRNSK